MRKISIGIFAMLTVVLFFLSTSVSVTATTYRETIVSMDSDVLLNDVSVSIIPWDAVWSYTGWTWTVNVNNGDNIGIRTDCEWSNAQPGTGDTGQHYFYMDATYGDIPTVYWDYYGPFNSKEDESGQHLLSVTIPDVNENTEIELYWYVWAKNTGVNPNVEDDDEHYGTIYLT